MRLPTPLPLAVAAALTLAAPAFAAPAGTTILVDQPSGFGAPLSGAGNHSDLARGGAVSASGRFVVFRSASDGLSTADDDRSLNAFRLDRETGTVELASVSTTGAAADSDSYDPQISDDGTRVLFLSAASNLHPDAADGKQHAFVHDFTTGETTFASRRFGKFGLPVAVEDAVLSGDGGTVAFSTREGLFGSDQNGTTDVYARRLATNVTFMVSRKDGDEGAIAAQESYLPAVNHDGTRFAFTSAAKLEDADENVLLDVYRRNVPGGGTPATTDLISARDATGKAGNGNSTEPALSPSGTAVAYTSRASDLDAGVTDDSVGRPDVFVFVGNDQIEISADALGGNATESNEPDIAGEPSANLQVAYHAAQYAQTLVPPGQVLVWNENRTTRIASRADGDGPIGDGDSRQPSIAASGGVVAFATDAQNLGGGIGGDAGDVAVRVLATGATQLASAPGSGPLAEDLSEVMLRSGRGELTPDGRYAVFLAGHDGLGVADRRAHIYRRDLRTGETTLVDRADGAGGAPSTMSIHPSISADGRLVAFTSQDALEPADTNGHADVYVRDVAAGTTRLVSRTTTGAPANGDSFEPVISADGRRVAFTSVADNLGDGDSDAITDIHVRDLAAGTTIYVSAPAQAGGKDDSFDAAIDADGTTVAFGSFGRNHGPADADLDADVYARDLDAGVTRLASQSSSGAHSTAQAGQASISADGNLVAFRSDANNFDPADTDSNADVFVRDVAAGTTRLVSRATGPDGPGAAEFSWQPAISPDGRAVAFVSGSADLGPLRYGVYVRRLDDATTVPVAEGDFPTLSGDGSCVLFASDSRTVVPTSGDFARVFVRSLGDTCLPDAPSGGQGGDPGDGGTAGDDPAPVLEALELARKRFRVGRARTAVAARARRGTVIRFQLSEPAAVTLRIQPRRRGARARVLRRAGAAGPNRVKFSGRVGRRALRPGRYRLVARARDAAGNVSAPRRVRFVVLGS